MDRNVIELLAPARDMECAQAAIIHGADAVYMGAPQFSARRAAGNSVEDIAAVAQMAHTYGARLHIALNTLLTDAEVPKAKEIAWQMYEAGADVLIVQDMALLTDDMPPIELHASTQCDNRTADRVAFWQNMGLKQVVLARELSLNEISSIAQQTTVRLEAFVHGALCVSYSGQCYMSLCRGGRSANRGECAQPCRLAYDVMASDGTMLMRHAHVLSLKDNNQSDNIEQLIDAGISSFKIEGRLKDADYVANITLHYRKLIDQILSHRPDLKRLSCGRVEAGFEPDPFKSFNRGFTDYFAHGRQPNIWQPQTPKSLGEPLGLVVGVRGNAVSVETDKTVANGDGICFVGQTTNPKKNAPISLGSFGGTQVNTSERQKGKLVLNVQSAKGLAVGQTIFRNNDVAFADTLSHDKTRRVVDISMTLALKSDGNLCLTIADADGVTSETRKPITPETARNPEAARDQMVRALCKLGQTPYAAVRINIEDSAAACFVPAAELNALRRDATEAHTAQRIKHFAPTPTCRQEREGTTYPQTELMRNGNVTNNEARTFYMQHGVKNIEWGYEKQTDSNRDQRVMTTRHCLMNAMGKCIRQHPQYATMTPLTLIDSENNAYEARINCAKCQMEIYSKSAH